MFNTGHPYLYSTVYNKNSSSSDLEENVGITLDNKGKLVKVKTFFYDGDQHEEVRKKCSGGWIQLTSDALSYNNVVTRADMNYARLMSSEDLVPLDMNGDGFIDYFYDGILYTNMGNGVWLTKEIGTGVLVRDYNGDGISDYLVKSDVEKTVKLFTGTADGVEMDSTVLAKNLVCSDYIWSYDFDKDGDIDILLPFDYSDNSGSYLLLMENKGDGTFKKHEYYISEKADFRCCMDIDADGNYEILAVVTIDADKQTDIKSYKITGTDINTTGTTHASAIEKYSSPKIGTLLVGDFVNNGKMMLVTGYSKDTDTKKSPGNVTLSDNVNKAPETPAKPTFYYDETSGQLKISWTKGKDAESSSADLTYELRIGTNRDKGDVLHADALADGTRRNFADGNQGYNLCRVIETASWPAGTYYISVQAIDPNHLGSPFSEYAVFEKSSPSAGFDIYSPEPTAIQDEITFALTEPYDENITYNWNFGGGVLKNSDTTNGTWTIVYNTGGEKVVSLQTVDKNGNQSVKVSRFFEVEGGNVKKEFYQTCEDNTLNTSIRLSADIDEDGISEIIGNNRTESNRRNNVKFFTYEADGVYRQLNKIWNLGMNQAYDIVPCDINQDGMVDFFSAGYDSDYKPAWLINNGDYDMEYESGDPFDLRVQYIDLNNDGLVDLLPGYSSNKHLYKNDGDYHSFTELNSFSSVIPEVGYDDYSDYDYYAIGDINNDGLIDLIAKRYSYYDADECYVLLNNGDFTFTLGELPEVLKNTTDLDHVSILKDLDNDGKLDAIAREGYYGYDYVIWSDGTRTELPYDYKLYYSWFDIDNNGYLDLLDTSEDAAICFYPNHRIETVKCDIGGELQPTYDGKGQLILNFGSPYADDDYHNAYIVTAANTTPAAPTNVCASQDSKGVMITWNHAVDKETPAVRMRYNLSVKHKDKTGEGAYVISPLNSGKNGIPVASNQVLIENNKYFIPISALPAGEYEVKVQGVDLLNAVSDFSETLNLTVLESSNIEMPTTTYTDVEITARLLTNTSTTVDWDGGEATSTGDNTYSVKWETAGMKNVKCGAQTVNVYVHEHPSFSVPRTVMAGATVSITPNASCTGKWLFKKLGGVNASDDVTVVSQSTENVTVIFNKTGEYYVCHQTETTESSFSVTVTESLSPNISIVDVDPTTGKHRINWTASDETPEGATSVNIYRETSISDAYTLIATLPLTATSFVDEESDPRITSSSYRMSYLLNYGEGAMGQKHTTMHAMINQGVGGAWNIIWTPYEGIDVQSYSILRGESADALSLLQEVSGYTRSFSDLTAVSGKTYYYAVETVASTSSASKAYKANRASSAEQTTRSNVVSTADAAAVDFLTGIEIVSVTGETVLSDSCKTLELVAIVTPKTATLHGVGWSIEEGADLATISQDGTVKLTGDHEGTVSVKATALDGSGTNASITIKVDNVTGIRDVQSDNGISVKVTDGGTKADVHGIAGNPLHVTLYNVEGGILMSKTMAEPGIVDLPSLETGVYILTVNQKGMNKSVKFFKK